MTLTESKTSGEQENVVNTCGWYKRAWTLESLASIILLFGSAGCITGPQFRSAALPAIQGGIDLILDGVVDGLFATIEVEQGGGDADNS